MKGKGSRECAKVEKSEQEKLNINSNYFVASDLAMDYAFLKLEKASERKTKTKTRKGKKNE